MCKVDFGQADAVVILDVLQYVSIEAQNNVLRRVRDTLATLTGLGFKVNALPVNKGMPFANFLLVAELG